MRLTFPAGRRSERARALPLVRSSGISGAASG
jgi:hypothetical protein